MRSLSSKPVIGLFGTCGQSRWRDPFIKHYCEAGIEFFNPHLEEGEWVPDRADEFIQAENQNLKTNDIVLFPITEETTGQGSLAEIGFSVLDTLRSLKNRNLIVYISPECHDPKATEYQIEESNRQRKLVLSKVIDESRKNPNVFVVDSLDKMFELSLELHQVILKSQSIRRKFNVA